MIAALALAWGWQPQAYDGMPLGELMGFFSEAVEQSDRERRRTAAASRGRG